MTVISLFINQLRCLSVFKRFLVLFLLRTNSVQIYSFDVMNFFFQIETMNDMVDGAFPVIRGRSHSQQTSGSMLHQNAQNRFSWKDWDKPGNI